MSPIRTIIMGAAGRDFHNFNTFFRGNKDYEVVAFTAAQIPDIEGRLYPRNWPETYTPKASRSIAEEELPELIRKHKVEQVIFAYSDVPHEVVMHKASLVNACGADFRLMGTKYTQIKSTKPVVSVCAVRTGSGKSQTTRRVSLTLRDMGYKVAAIRHPMPYGNLVARKSSVLPTTTIWTSRRPPLKSARSTSRTSTMVSSSTPAWTTRRLFEPPRRKWTSSCGTAATTISRSTFLISRSSSPIRIVPGTRPGIIPARPTFVLADVFVINKVDTADPEKVINVRENLRKLNPTAIQIEAASPLFVDDPEAIRGKRVLVIEDGPTLTHGEMAYGAGFVAARRFGAAEIVDPRPFAVKSIAATYQKYPKTGPILPAMGYGEAQMKDLEATINASDVDLVIVGTPIDLTRVIKIKKPYQRVRYELQEIGQPTLADILKKKFGKKK